MRPLCWGIEVVFWLVSFLGCSLVTVSGFRMYFIRSSSIAGGQLPCCSWTRAHSFSRSLPGCAKCLIGCRAYTSGQTDGDSKGQSSGGFRSWSRCLPSLPWQQLLCLPRPHSPRPQALPFLCLSSTCLAYRPLWLLSDSLTPCMVVGPTCVWDVPAPALHFCTQHLSPSVLCPLLSSLFAFPRRKQLYTGGSRACFFPDVSEAPGTWQIVDINKWLWNEWVGFGFMCLM